MSIEKGTVMNITTKVELWRRLASADRPILLYGMGNGADKILRICEARHIPIADTFASDGFVRGHEFHGKRVLSYGEAKQRYKDFIVLLSFATSRPEVLDTISRVAAEQTLFAPDVPVFGDTLFDMAFFRENENRLDRVMALLADEASRHTLRSVVDYKLSGDPRFLASCEADEELVTQQLICPYEITQYVDLGAYNGDTVKRLVSLAPRLARVLALEPDRRNFRKLSEYADSLSDVSVTPLPIAAWDRPDTLLMDASGNRNANLSDSGRKNVSTAADALDNVIGDMAPDYIKYDVEGSEYRALLGSRSTIAQHRPRLLISLYHRSEDLFLLPELLTELAPDYRFYLRKLRYIPAWDLNLYAIPKEKEMITHV